MKILLAQQNYHIGNFEANANKIIEGINLGKKQGADLVLFSELCICGYPPRDFLEFNDFINKCYETIDVIKEYADDIGVLIGSPARNPQIEGKDLFNAAFLLHEKQIKAEVHKTLLPTYDIFDEYRYFEPAYHWNIIEFKGKRLAVTICEDIWNLGDNPLYRTTPMEVLMQQQPDIMLNLSASPFSYAQDEMRTDIIAANVAKYKLPLLYCNTVGAQTEIVFDGGSLAYAADGRLIKALKYFEEDYALIDVSQAPSGSPEGGETYAQPQLSEKTNIYAATPASGFGAAAESPLRGDLGGPIAEIHQALLLGISDYFKKMGFTKAILGASGGIDSAVVQALAVEALGKENVRVLLMPSEYSSGHSVSDAEQLSKNLENEYDIVAIKDIYDSFIHTLQPQFRNLPFSVAEENIQARTRGTLLMAVANKFGYILLNTSNKSELAVGYGTLYGDMAGGLSVLGDVYKVQIFALAQYINRNNEIIPNHILIKPPSAELRPGQKDTDSLPDYDILDPILYQYIERRQGPKELIAQGFEPALVSRILRLVNTSEYKRNQFCPIIRVSTKAFGVGRRLPIVAKYLS